MLLGRLRVQAEGGRANVFRIRAELVGLSGRRESVVSLLAQEHLLLVGVHLTEGLIRMHVQLLSHLSVHDVLLAESWIRRQLRSFKKHIAVVVFGAVRVRHHLVKSKSQ